MFVHRQLCLTVSYVTQHAVLTFSEGVQLFNATEGFSAKALFAAIFQYGGI